MIQIFKLVLLLVVSQVAFGQAPSNYTNINGRYRWIAGMFDSTFHIPKGTTPSLRTGGSTNSGGLFYNTSDSSVYTYTGTQWIKLRGSLNPSDTSNKYITQVYKKSGSDSVFYVKGGTHTWAFNDSTGAPGGGGGGKIYYFNGGVNMGTFGGFTMYELGDTANTGAAANFTRNTTGNIANFITDANKPGLLQIPAGVWTVDAWMSETGGGANHAQIWAVLEKWNGSTITTIATSPIEEITEGNTPNLYTWAITVPTTTLAVTDRIIIQFYITNTNGKTVTLYTQNGYVGEVHTTFTTGIGALNGLTAASQYLTTGTSGTDFNISSVTATHTFNLPTASATNRGALSTADWTTFNNKISPADTASMLSPYLRKIDTASLSNRINLKVNISDTASMLNPYLRKVDTASLSNRINLKVNISDTASMLSPYLRKIDTASLSNRINLKVNISDTANMLNPYLRKVDTASLSNRINTKLNISDTATMLGNYVNNVGYGLSKVSQVVSADSATLASYFLRRKDSLTSTNLLGYVTRNVLADTASAIRSADAGGTVTSVATNNGTGITGGTFTTSGTIAADTLILSTRAWRQKGVDSLQANINLKLNISDTASMLSPYLRKIDTASLSNRINTKLNISDTSSMLTNYINDVGYGLLRTSQVARADSATLANYFLRRKDSLTSTNLLGYITRTVLADSAAAIRAAAGSIGGSGTTNRVSKFTASGTIGNSSIADSSSSVAMTILSNGNIGINTTAPNERLEIVGTSRFTRTTSPSVHLNLSMENGFAEYDARGSIDHVWETSGTERMRLTFGGNLGVGTASPDSMLTVLEGARFQRGVRMSGLPSAPGTRALRIDANGTLSVADTTTGGGGGIGGSGTTNYLPKFTASTTLGDSRFFDNGTVTFLGNGDVNATPSTGIFSGTGGTGTNIAGAELRIRGGASTGNAAGGIISFYTSAAGSSGTGVNAATERMRIDANGNLGLGVTPSASWASGYRAFEFGNTSTQQGFLFSNGINDTWLGSNSIFNGSNWTRIGTGFATGYEQVSGEHTWQYAASGSAGTTFSFTVGMRLNASGNLGIGTGTIGSRLQVNGNAAIGYSASTAAPTNGLAVAGNVGVGLTAPAFRLHVLATDGLMGGFATTSATGGYVGFRYNTSTTFGYIGSGNFLVTGGAVTDMAITTDSGNILFATGSAAERGRFTSTGNFGIGTTTIGSRLQVNGNAAIGYSASTAAPTNGLSIAGNTTIGTTTASGKFTIDPDDNQVGLAITGTSLTSANAQSLIDLAQTWNTTGNPAAIKLNITNTASGASAYLMDLQVGGTTQFRVTKAGAIRTAAPTSGTANDWKLGSVVGGTTVLDTTQWLEVEVGGTLYRVALVTLPEPEPGATPASTPEDRKISEPVKTSSQRIQELENEIQELRKMVNFLMPTSKNKK